MSKGTRSYFSEASFGSLDELTSAAPEPSRKNRRKSSIGGVVGEILGGGKKNKMSAPNNVASGPSAAADKNRNVWANHIKNGDDRTHVPPMGKKVLIIRVVQLVFAVVFLVLAAFAAFTLNMGNLPAFGLSFFVFSWTVVYFVWLGLSILFYPVLYHWIAHIVIEGLANVFWLAAWASLASLASALNVARAGYYYVLAARQTLGTGVYQPQRPPPPPPHEIGVPPDGGRGPGGAGAGAGASSAAAASAAAATARSTTQAAKVAICVDAGLGALIWVLFVTTLIATSEFFSFSLSCLPYSRPTYALRFYRRFLCRTDWLPLLTRREGTSIINHRKNNRATKKGKGPEVAEV
ncbi:uncharacterized protein PG986_012581 [Apiospora aurea]|uniref:MARVEL domain-containing protein n=1 Tax=Apiospora aurea TaxID=335848 RepID=A0ABR1Q0F1_9PEZI